MREFFNEHNEFNVSETTSTFSHIRFQAQSLITKTPRKFHPALCYDPEGSFFFEELCKQPEYYLSRIERKILLRESESIINIANPAHIIDLGCGNMKKTQALIHEASKKGDVHVHACDFDKDIISTAKNNLEKFYYDRLTVKEYNSCFEECIDIFGPHKSQKLFLFLGSTFGNLAIDDQKSLFLSLSNNMRKSDYFIIGVDLLKNEKILEAAYNDSGGYQEKSVMQMLVNCNREYGAEFDLRNFEHVSRYEPERRCVVSYLRSKCDQDVRVNAWDITLNLKEGEEIEAEIREKFVLSEILEFIQSFGLRPVKIEVDDEIPYALLLFSGPKENVPTEGEAEGE